MQAELAAVDTIDTLRHWVVMWDATPAGHRLQVRETDGARQTQTLRTRPFPDGATGHHTEGRPRRLTGDRTETSFVCPLRGSSVA